MEINELTIAQTVAGTINTNIKITNIMLQYNIILDEDELQELGNIIITDLSSGESNIGAVVRFFYENKKRSIN